MTTISRLARLLRVMAVFSIVRYMPNQTRGRRDQICQGHRVKQSFNLTDFVTLRTLPIQEVVLTRWATRSGGAFNRFERDDSVTALDNRCASLMPDEFKASRPFTPEVTGGQLNIMTADLPTA